MQISTVKIGNSLRGEWTHGKRRERLIVLCHGYQSSSKEPTLVYLSNALNKLGYDTFSFDFTANTRGFDAEHQVEDIRSIVAHFAAYPEIVVVGASFAALPASIATIQTPGITGLVTLSGFFGTAELGHEHRKNYLKFRLAALCIPKYWKIRHYFKKFLVPERIKVPVLVIHPVGDTYVFIAQSRRFYARLTAPKRYVELDSASHGIRDDRDRDKVVTEVDRWVTNTEPQGK